MGNNQWPEEVSLPIVSWTSCSNCWQTLQSLQLAHAPLVWGPQPQTEAIA